MLSSMKVRFRPIADAHKRPLPTQSSRLILKINASSFLILISTRAITAMDYFELGKIDMLDNGKHINI